VAARWLYRRGESPHRLSTLPKYVLSATLQHPDWNKATVLKGDVLREVSNLKQKVSGQIVVPASIQIVRTLMQHDLVDELRLKIFPVVLGAGERLFGETRGKNAMRLVAVRTLDGDTVFLTYERAHNA